MTTAFFQNLATNILFHPRYPQDETLGVLSEKHNFGKGTQGGRSKLMMKIKKIDFIVVLSNDF